MREKVKISEPLLPCPFCGASAIVTDHGKIAIVGCPALSMLCPNPTMAVFQDAATGLFNVRPWNRRV